MKSAGLKTTVPRNSTDHRSGLTLSVARGNSYQVWWVPDAFGLICKKEETLGLIRKENGCEAAAKIADFKPATFRGFRNVAENPGEPLS